MKYDDACFHYGGDFPEDLPTDAAATHMGMFLAWAILSDLGGKMHCHEQGGADLVDLRNRTITPGAFIMERCDEKLTKHSLNKEGNAFAKAYYNLESGQYVEDYVTAFSDQIEEASIYHVPDTWENFERIKPVLDARLHEWRSNI